MNGKRFAAQQPDLFAHVLAAYAGDDAGTLSNAALYARVEEATALGDRMHRRVPIGVHGKLHNPVTRAIRWHQQTLRRMGVLQRVDGARGIWKLTRTNKAGLHRAEPGVKLVAFSTRLGVALWGACEQVFADMREPIHLCVTSPPFALAKPRAYGGPSEIEYTDFITRALEPIVRNLVPGGSICLNLGTVFSAGLPTRSLYRERLTLALHDRFGLHKCDDLIWHNPTKAPGPVQWASIRRVQLNEAYEPILWMTNDPKRLRADNRRVLQPHSDRHLAFVTNGGVRERREYANGAHVQRVGAFTKTTAGKIPRNVLTVPHRCKDSSRYIADAKRLDLPVHGAVMPLAIPEFLVRFLTEAGDLCVDPFGGTVKLGVAAEKHNRRWLVAEIMLDYLKGSAPRFSHCNGFTVNPAVAAWHPSQRVA